jgi:hypothetical protein
VKKLFLVLCTIAIALPSVAENLYIPVAGVVAGANNTLFRTDVRIFNPSTQRDLGVTLHFLPQGMNGANISGRVVNVPKRQMVVLDNVVGNFFGMPSGSIGAIRIDSDEDFDYDIVADSRTYTDSPNATAPGTFGQFIPALNVTEARAKTVVLHLAWTQEFRSNIGVMNPSNEEVTVRANLYSNDGARGGTANATLVIPPKSMRQVPVSDFFGGVFIPNGYVTFEATAPVFTWGSVIDNRSGDPIYVPGAEDKAEVRPLG